MLDRHSVLLEGITKEMLGIEIGPWHNPLVPKRDGYNSLSLDVFDGDELRSRARSDGHIPNELVEKIEDVDLVGTVSDLDFLAEKAGIVGKVDYIISSHNFEHTPDPIRFLQASSRILKPGGILSIAVPDKRRCFDFFRPHSTAGDFLDAFYHKRQGPSPGQIFDHFSLISVAELNGEERIAWTSPIERDRVRTQEPLPHSAFSILNENGEVNGGAYVDAHCWTFTPASLKFVLSEIARLGLLKMRVDDVLGPNLHEIYVRLSNVPPDHERSDERLQLIRTVDRDQRDSGDDREVPAQVAAISEELARTRRELTEIRNSSSWKVTAPLRAIASVLRR
jgi:SAM-dependent methyltransferase